MNKQPLLIQDAYAFESLPPKVREAPWEKLYRFFFGDDVFISYSRADAIRYVPSLAARLAAKGHICFFDQLSADPSEDLPERLKKKILRSTVFVLVGTRGAVASSAVRKEVELFRRTRRSFIPVDVDGALVEQEHWRDVIGTAKIREEGARVRKGDPSLEVINLIKDSFRYTRRSQWLRASLLAGVSVILITAAASLLLIRTAEAKIRAAEAEAAAIKRQAVAEVAAAGKKVGEAQQRLESATAAAADAQKLADDATAAEKVASTRREAAEHAMRQAQELERQSAARAADTSRREAGSRAVLLSREPGMETDALALALEAAEQSFSSQGELPEQVLTGLAASATAADYSLPLETLGTLRADAIQISPNGEKIFAVLYEQQTYAAKWVLWDVRAGRRMTLALEKGSFARGAFSRDAKRLAVATGATSGVRVWDLSGPEPRPLQTACGRGRQANAVALDNDGSHVVFHPSGMFGLTICEVATGREEALNLNSYIFGGFYVDIAFTRDDEPVMYGATLGSDPTLQSRVIYFPRSGRVVALKSPSGPFGERFLGFDDEGSIILLQGGGPTFMGPEAPPRIYIQSPNGGLRKLTDYKGEVHSAAFHGGRARVVTISGDKIRVADAHYSPSFAALRAHLRPPDVVAFSPDDRTVLTIGGDGAAHLWDVQTGLLRHTLMSPSDFSEKPLPTITSRIRPLAFLPDGSRVVMINEKGEVQIWDVGTGRPTCAAPGRPVEGSIGATVALSFAAGGDYVMAYISRGFLQGYVRFIDARTCQPMGVFDEGQFLLFSEDGSGIITSTDKPGGGWEMKLWSLRGVEFKPDTPIHLTSTSLGQEPDGRPVLPWAGGPQMYIDKAEAGVYVWRRGAKTGVRLEGLQSIFFKRYHGAFSADGTRTAIVTGTEARVWDTRSGNLLMTFPCEADMLAGRPLSLSPDGSRLLIVGKDHTARIYPTSPEGFLGAARRLLGR
jgi:WD40 repeat protein